MTTAGTKFLSKCLDMNTADAIAATKPDILDRLVELRDRGVPFTINACIPSIGGKDNPDDFAVLVTAGFVNTDIDELSAITRDDTEDTAPRTVAYLTRTMRDAASIIQCGLNVAGSKHDTDTLDSLMEFLSDLREYNEKPEVTH